MSSQVNKRQRITYNSISRNDGDVSSVVNVPAEVNVASSSVSEIVRCSSCGQEGHKRSSNRLCLFMLLKPVVTVVGCLIT